MLHYRSKSFNAFSIPFNVAEIKDNNKPPTEFSNAVQVPGPGYYYPKKVTGPN